MLTPEPEPWPKAFVRRTNTCKAMRVTHANLRQCAQWCGGTTWGAGVVVPVLGRDGKRGETSAAVGDFIVQTGGTFSVWPPGSFITEWRTAP